MLTIKDMHCSGFWSLTAASNIGDNQGICRSTLVGLWNCMSRSVFKFACKALTGGKYKMIKAWLSCIPEFLSQAPSKSRFRNVTAAPGEPLKNIDDRDRKPFFNVSFFPACLSVTRLWFCLVQLSTGKSKQKPNRKSAITCSVKSLKTRIIFEVKKFCLFHHIYNMLKRYRNVILRWNFYM